MSPAAPPRELIQALANAGNDVDRASDVIEEFIIYRRGKGDTLFDVSNSLKLLENRGPARTATAIHKAQYVTNVPPASDLTAAAGPSHSSSASPATLLSYLLSEPAPPVAQARQVILEYVLAREHRHQERNPGRGGKHTLGSDGFEEIALRLGEVEDGLRGTGPLGQRGASEPIPDEELSPARQLGLALVLSLRMLLSYFSLPDLARQLLCQTPQDAERTLVQHIRRRSPGEGRFGVGRELEYVESLTLNRRPALRPAFRSARARTHLPQRAVYPIVLPAPSKSACIKLLSAFLGDIDQAGPTAALSYTAQGSSSHASIGSARGRKGSPKAPSFSFGSPHAPGSPVFATSSPSNSPTRRMSTLAQLPPDTTPIENYSLELLSEFLTREKREYILKNKWVKSGRDQLGRDLGDIETALCVNKGVASHHAADLLPVFLLLRRTYSLPVTQLPAKIVGAAYEMLPTAPEPDSVPLHLPTVSSTTAALYVNPRLDDSAALDHVEELLESEREKGINAAVSEEKTVSWLRGLISQIEKRFPDGSYATVFEQARLLAEYPRAWPDAATSAAFPSHPLVDRSQDGGPGHRRSKSYATTPSADSHGPSQPKSPTSPMSHSRSASMPMRSSLYSSGSHHNNNATRLPTSYNDYTDQDIMAQVDPHGGARPPPQAVASEKRDAEEDDEVDSDSDDSEFARRVAPAGLGLQNTARANQTMQRSRQPPMLSINAPDPRFGVGMFDSIPSARSFTSSVHTPLSATSAAGSYDGWWDVVSSSTDNSPAVPKTAPWTGDTNPDGMMSPSPSGSLARVAEEEEHEAPHKRRDPTPETSALPPMVTRGLQFNNLPPGAGAPVAIGTSPTNVGPGSNMSNPMTITTGGAGGGSSTMSGPMTVTGRSPLNSSTGSHSHDGHVGGTPTHAAVRTPLTGSPAGPHQHNPSPVTQSTGPSPLRNVPAAAAASPMSAAAAAAIAATEAKLGGVSLNNGSSSGSSSTHTTPSTTPTAPHRAAFDNAPPVPNLPSGAQNGSPAGYETSYSTWRSGEPQTRPQRARTYGSAQHMANTRPPPVPANFDRPGFPSGSNPPGRPRNHSNATPPSSMSNRPMMPPEPSPMPPQPQSQSPTAPTTTISSSTQNFDTSDMGLEFYPSEDAGTSLYKPYTPMLGNLPAAAAAPAPKSSKLGGFGRSMSLGGRMGRNKDKENPPAVPPATVKRQATQTRVANNPERWNKNMVAQLMGPSAAAKK